MSGTPIAIYFLIKYTAYVAWCYAGARWFAPERGKFLQRALLLGILRAALGLVFGILIFFGVSFVYGELSGVPARSILAYLGVYVPVRWVEWSIISAILSRESRSIVGFAWGITQRERFWRAGGIAISCLADIPVMIVMGGVVPGRFMC